VPVPNASTNAKASKKCWRGTIADHEKSHRLPRTPDWVVPPVIILLEANLPTKTWVKTGAL
jgi:hypothetical protein